MINYDTFLPINGSRQKINNINIVSCIAIEQASQLFTITLGGGVLFNLYISSCRFQSEDSDSVFEWLQSNNTNAQPTNNIFLSLTSVEFFNSYITQQAFAPWLTTSVECSTYDVHDPTDPNQPLISTDGFAIFKKAVSLYNYKAGIKQGAGTHPELFEYADITIL
jgi:hypothetical protein